MPEPPLRALGQPLRRDYLLEQADYSLAVATADSPELAALLKEGFLAALAEVRNEVARSLDDKSVAAAEAKLATGTQNVSARNLKLWGRAAVERVSGARRAGVRLVGLGLPAKRYQAPVGASGHPCKSGVVLHNCVDDTS